MTKPGTFSEWHCMYCDKHFYKSGMNHQLALAIAKANHIRGKSHQAKVAEWHLKQFVEKHSTTWEIRWKAKVDGKPWKSGKDIITVKNPDFDQYDAEDLLDYFANEHIPDDKHPDMPNFNAYYQNANWLENFELVSAKRVDKK